ncbi:MAG TPA: hypothetical protein VEG42_04060 [Thermoplasmata archaeon]|nr:hypothetical protein [Thermoplasmata archaeon]
MSAGTAPPRTVAPISATARAWWAYSTYVVFGMGVALLGVTAYVIVTSPGLFRVDLPGALLGMAAFLIGIAILDRLPRHVFVGEREVEFHYLLSRVTLRWDQLTAPALVGKGFIAFRATSGAKGVWGQLTVTMDQARAILTHPSCPSFDIPTTIADAVRAG